MNQLVDAIAVRPPEESAARALVSSGLDSESTARAAGHLAERGDRPVPHTFSAVFNDVPECDEWEFVESVVDCEDQLLAALADLVANRLDPEGHCFIAYNGGR